jgi:hypothetical protein
VVEQIRDALAEDPSRRGDDAEWAADVATIVERHALRIDNLREQLASQGYPLD